MQQAKIDLEIEGGEAVQTLGDLRNNVARLNSELENAALGSEEYKKLNQELIKSNRQVKNLELGFESLDNEQLATSIGGVAGAVGDVTSAMILLGGESDNITQIAGNIQTAIGVSMAFKGAIEGASDAMKLFNNIARANPFLLIATAIGLIITGIVLLVKNWDAVIDGFVNLGQWVKKTIDSFGAWKNTILLLLGPIGWLIKAWDYFFGEQVKALNEQEALEEKARKRRIANEKEIGDQHKKRLKEIKEKRNAEIEAFNGRQTIFDLDIERAEAEGRSSHELKVQKAKDILENEKLQLESITNQLASWRKYYEDLFVLSGKDLDDFKKQMKGRGVDLDAALKYEADLLQKYNDRVYSAESKFIAARKDQREAAVSELLEVEQDGADEMVKIQEDDLKQIEEARNDFYKRLEDAQNEIYDSQLSDQEREINAVRDKYFTLLEEAELYNEDVALLEEEQANKIAEIEQFYEDEALLRKQEQAEAERQLRQENFEKKVSQAEELFAIADNLNSLISSREIDRIKQKEAAGKKLTESEIKRLKRQDQIQRAFALAQIAADTARGIAGAVASGASQPFPYNIPAIISGIAAVLAGAAQAAKVMSAAPPTIDVGSITESNQTDRDIQNNPITDPFAYGSTMTNASNKVYVVESDITGMQKKVGVIESEATFG